jgi:hypothetical protein
MFSYIRLPSADIWHTASAIIVLWIPDDGYSSWLKHAGVRKLNIVQQLEIKLVCIILSVFVLPNKQISHNMPLQLHYKNIQFSSHLPSQSTYLWCILTLSSQISFKIIQSKLRIQQNLRSLIIEHTTIMWFWGIILRSFVDGIDVSEN